MKVKDYIKFLEKQDQEREVAICLYRESGPTLYRVASPPLGNVDFTDTRGDKYVFSVWIDDCSANKIKEAQ